MTTYFYLKLREKLILILGVKKMSVIDMLDIYNKIRNENIFCIVCLFIGMLYILYPNVRNLVTLALQYIHTLMVL